MTSGTLSHFGRFNTLQRQIDRLFEDMVFDRSRLDSNLAFIPAAELSQTAESIQLRLEIPGMEAKDLDVQVTKNAVSIKGERTSETKKEQNGSTRSEFRYGKFQRLIPLPVEVQNNQVSAEYKDGILTLTLPKTEAEKNRVVKVNLN